jgi:hypothetical protein
MKKVLCFFIASFLLGSCQQSAIEKPDNLIDEETMEDIIYDLALLDAIKTNNPAALEQKNIDPSTYVYDKYDIDSLQFVSSNHYYASDVHNYLKMYKRVEDRLNTEKTEIDTIIAQKQNKLDLKKETKDRLKEADTTKKKPKRRLQFKD